jgi:hypothetical protein
MKRIIATLFTAGILATGALQAHAQTLTAGTEDMEPMVQLEQVVHALPQVLGSSSLTTDQAGQLYTVLQTLQTDQKDGSLSSGEAQADITAITAALPASELQALDAAVAQQGQPSDVIRYVFFNDAQYSSDIQNSLDLAQSVFDDRG